MSVITGSLEVDTEERKVSLAWVRSSERVGISITFGWCRMAVVVPLDNPSHVLIILVQRDWTFLILDSGTASTARVK